MSTAAGESDAIIAIREKLRGNKVDETKLKASELSVDPIEEEEEKKDLRRRFREILLERNEEGYKYESLKLREIARIKHDNKDIMWEMLNENQVIELVIRNLTDDEILRKLNRLKKWSTREMYYSKEGLFLPDENPRTFVVLPRPSNVTAKAQKPQLFPLHNDAAIANSTATYC